MAANLDNYVEVKDRIAAFYNAYPEGSIQGDYEFLRPEGHDQTLIVYCAKVYRTPEDRRPAVAFASEPYPGKTNFTRDSELMNAETSAIGRAIAAFGFEVHKSVASKQEVQARQPDTPKAEAHTLPQADVEALMMLVESKRSSGLTFEALSTVLGGCGIDAPAKRSIQSVEQTVAKLSVEQAVALEQALEGWSS